MLAGSAAAAVRLEVEGAGEALTENIRAHIGPLPQNADELSRGFLRRSRNAAQRGAEALGYYNAQISVERQRQGEDGVLQVQVEPGPRVIIERVELEILGEAADDRRFGFLVRRFPLAENQPLNHGEYEAAKDSLMNLALRRGYLDARLTRSRVEVDAVANTARVLLTFDSGPRYQYGQVRFSDSPFRDELLARLVPFEAGEPYRAEGIVELNRNLIDSRYFSDVQVRPRTDAPVDGQVPVEVALTPQERNHVGVGVGYATDVGPRLRLTWTKPWINDRGHSLSASTELSARRRNLTGEYRIPLRSPLTDYLQFQTGYQWERFTDSESDRLTASVHREIQFDNGWQRSVYLRLNREDFRQGEDDYTTTLLIPGLSFTRTRSRGGLDPRYGDRQLLVLEGADQRLGSDISLVRVRLGTRWLHSFDRDHRVFLRGDLGAVATSRFAELPPSLRFFAGGDQSIRGFEYNTVGPRDSRNEVVGGRYLLVGSAEYDFRVADKWRLATFVDAGTATDDFSERFKVGAGVGVHWISPVGPVRLEFAWGVSEPDPPFRVHISMGPRL